MPRINKATLKSTIIIVLMIITASFLRLYHPYHEIPRPCSLIRSLIYLVLFIWWGISIRKRIVQTEAGFYLRVINALMIFWLCARTLKYMFGFDPWIMRALWYLYYLPLLFIPLLTVYVAVSLGKPENFRLPKPAMLLHIPTVLLLLLVLTNDFHQWVFAFPPGLPRSDASYFYGLGYWPVAFWSLSLAGAALFIIVSKCHVPRSKRIIWLPLIPFITMIIYIVLYILELPILRIIAGDITVALSLLIMATFESCIRVGLIQSNTHYRELFHASTIAAQITDKDYELVLSSKEAKNIPIKLLEKTQTSPLILDGGLRISAAPIAEGYVVWQDDIRGLTEILEHLSDAGEFLEDRNTALAEEYRTSRRLSQLEEQNRLYNLLQKETAEEIVRLEKLVAELAGETSPDEEKIFLAKIILHGAYIKRRNNFIFLGEKEGLVPIGELGHCIRETLQNLELFGIQAEYLINFGKDLPLALLIEIYQVFHRIVEEVFDLITSLFLVISSHQDLIVMSLRLSDLPLLPALSIEGLKAQKEEEGDWILTYQKALGGELT